MPTESAIDIKQASEAVEGDKEFYLELTEAFFGEYDTLLEQIKSGIENQDAKQLETNAHSIKGALLNLAARPAAATALILEKCGAESNFDSAKNDLTTLITQIADYKSVVEQIRSGSYWEDLQAGEKL